LDFLDDVFLPILIIIAIKLITMVVMDDTRSILDEDILLSKSYIGACFVLLNWYIIIYWIVRIFV